METGPDSERTKKIPITNQFTDSSGTTYNVGKLLGQGVEGQTFLGTVVKLGKNADPRLQVGSEVAVKQQSIGGSGNDAQKREDLKMEMEILAREGSFFGSGEVPFNDKTYLLMAIPVIKGKTLRDRLYEIDDAEMDQKNSYKGRRDVSAQDKASWSYQILRDYAAQHMLGIHHVDEKPDNILVTDDGKVKVIDFGNSYLRDRYEEHPKGFQSPGPLYSAPENYDDTMDAKDRRCTIRASEYAIGIMIASIWTDKVYERDADLHASPGNDALGARKLLEGIIGPNGVKPPDMPDDLFSIIRHLTAVNPTMRPESIVDADGLRSSSNPILQQIVQAHDRLEAATKEIVTSHKVADFREMAKANGKGALENFNVQVQSGTQPPNPLADFEKLQDYMDKLRAIEFEYANTLPARKNQIARLEKAYGDVLNEMMNSGNPHFVKIAQTAQTLDAKPTQKMQQVMKDFKKVAPEVIQEGCKKASLEGEVYLRLNNILQNNKDPSSLRMEIAKLYTQVLALRDLDKENKHQYKPVIAHLNKMLTKLDNARTLEARQLQGLPPPAQVQQKVRARLIRSYLRRARSFIKALQIVEHDPIKRVQMARELASKIQQQSSGTASSAKGTQPTSSLGAVSIGSLQTMLIEDAKPEKKQDENLNPLSLGPPSHLMRFSSSAQQPSSFRAQTPQVEMRIPIPTMISALRHLEPRMPVISGAVLTNIAQALQNQIGTVLTPQTKRALDSVEEESKPKDKKQKTLGS